MSHRVQFTTDQGPFEVAASSFDAAIDVIIDALASDVRADGILSQHGARYEPEVIEEAVRKRLAPYATGQSPRGMA